MAVHRSGKALSTSAARTADGNSSVLNANTGSAVSVLLATTAKTGTSPTLTAKIQWSYDKTTWYDGPTADNFTVVSNTAPTTEFKDVTLRAPYMRVNYAFGGSATPGYTFSIEAFVRG